MKTTTPRTITVEVRRDVAERYTTLHASAADLDLIRAAMRVALEQADTDYVSILQDDDVVARGYAARICAAFRQFPAALHWQARIYCAIDEKIAAWFGGCGPWVPMGIMVSALRLGSVLSLPGQLTAQRLQPVQSSGESWTVNLVPAGNSLPL